MNGPRVRPKCPFCDHPTGRSDVFISTRGNVVWNFTVSNRTGTFVYRSRIAGDGNMWGNITISTAGVLGTILGNPLVVIGMVVVFGAILAIAVWAYRRPRHPPEPPQSQ